MHKTNFKDKIEDFRTYKKLPNISKSLLKTYNYFCKYLTFNQYFLKEKNKTDFKRVDIGTDTHMIFSQFFKYVDIDYMYKKLKIDPSINLDDNPITHYFYGICVSLTEKYDRGVKVLQRIFFKFAKLQASRFLQLYSMFNGNKFKVWKYFEPDAIEKFMEFRKYNMFGTVDNVYIEIDKKGNKQFLITDYKTGHIPADVMKGPRTISDETSVKLPSKFMMELHFYGLLWALNNGWKFTDERVEKFIMNDEFQAEDGTYHKFGLGKTKEEHKRIEKLKYSYLSTLDYKLKKFNGEKYVPLKKGELQMGIIFLTGDPTVKEPIVAKKKFGYYSLRTVLVKLNTMRQMILNINNDDAFLIREMKTRPEYNMYRCGTCSRREKCLKEIEDEFRSRKSEAIK